MNRELALLQLSEAKGLGPKTLHKIFKRISTEEITVEDFVSLPIKERSFKYGISPLVSESIYLVKSKALEEYIKLQDLGIGIVSVNDFAYPFSIQKNLRDQAPPILYILGSSNIFSLKGVGFCGSRKSSELGLKATFELSGILAKRGINIVSGYAAGVDLAAHKGALIKKGVTTIVLAEGIMRYKKKAEIEEFLSQTNNLVISEFPPEVTWSISNAMQRNRTICGISNAMILVESGITGGTFSAGEDTLKLKRPLFVINYNNTSKRPDGNDYFLKRGAKPINIDNPENIDIENLIIDIDRDYAGKIHDTFNGTLFDKDSA